MSANLLQETIATLKKHLQAVPFLKLERVTTPVNGEYDHAVDAVVDLKLPQGRQKLLVEYKSAGQPQLARQAIYQLQHHLKKVEGAYGVFLAPFISRRAIALCTAAGIGYADLAGNCHLVFQTVYIHQEGQPNLRIQRREGHSLYATKASRLVRVLLVQAAQQRHWKVAELAAEAQVSVGQVSNVKRQLMEREWLTQDKLGFWLNAPEALLEDWSKNYTFRRNLVQDYYASRSGPELDQVLADTCQQAGVEFAFTGFSGAVRLAPAVRPARAMLYVADQLDLVAERAELKAVESGATISLLKPYDAGVFYGAQPFQDGMPVVTAVQLYLDLKSFRGRGEEAAEAVLEQVLRPTW